MLNHNYNEIESSFFYAAVLLQITHVALTSCDLTSDWSLKVEDIVQSLPRLNGIVISEPTQVERFPHLTTVRRLTLENIPTDCGDWDWLKDLNNLETVDVSVKRTSTDAGRFHAENTKAKLTEIRGDDAVSLLVHVVDNLPKHLQTKVYLHGRKSRGDGGGVVSPHDFAGGGHNIKCTPPPPPPLFL